MPSFLFLAILVIISWYIYLLDFNLLKFNYAASGFPEREIFIYFFGDWMRLEFVKAFKDILQGFEITFKGLELSKSGFYFGLIMMACMFFGFLLIGLQCSLVDELPSMEDSCAPYRLLKCC